MAVSGVPSSPYPPVAPAAQPAKPSTPAPSGTTANSFNDEVTLSPQAQTIMAGGKPLKLADGGAMLGFGIDHAMMEAVNEYHGRVREHMHRFGDFMRETFDMGTPEESGGMMLTGEISTVIKKAMANAGMPEPEKPAEVKAWEAARNAGAPAEPEPKPGPGTQGTSMIVFHLPEDKGGGSVELWFDNKGLETLASLSADDLKKNLLDLMKGGAKADAVNDSIKNGVFGKFMDENSAYHPEYKDPQARLAYVDPAAPAGSSPLFMIQSQSRPDYVAQHADELVDAVVKLFKGAKPTA